MQPEAWTCYWRIELGRTSLDLRTRVYDVVSPKGAPAPAKQTEPHSFCNIKQSYVQYCLKQRQLQLWSSPSMPWLEPLDTVARAAHVPARAHALQSTAELPWPKL